MCQEYVLNMITHILCKERHLRKFAEKLRPGWGKDRLQELLSDLCKFYSKEAKNSYFVAFDILEEKEFSLLTSDPERCERCVYIKRTRRSNACTCMCTQSTESKTWEKT